MEKNDDLKNKKTTIKRVRKLILKGNKMNYLFAVILLSITSLFEIGISYILMKIIDNSVNSRIDVVMQIAVLALPLAGIYLIISYAGYRRLSAFTKRGVCNTLEIVL